MSYSLRRPKNTWNDPAKRTGRLPSSVTNPIDQHIGSRLGQRCSLLGLRGDRR